MSNTSSSAVVLDATFFFTPIAISGLLSTTPQDVLGLCDLRGKARYTTLIEQGLVVLEPSKESIAAVREAARESHNIALSDTDISVLALAKDLCGIIATDDFAIQHTARKLRIPVQPLMQRRAKKRDWVLLCTGCGVQCEDIGDCPICGSPVQKRNANRIK
jgi:UPF0271 protein